MNRALSSGLFLTFVGFLWWLASSAASLPILGVGVGLAMLLALLQLPPVYSKLLGPTAPVLSSSMGPLSIGLGFVGLIGFDLSFLDVVNKVRNDALQPPAGLPAEMLRGDWLAMDLFHSILFFAILTFVAWIAPANPPHKRLLATVWYLTLLLYAFHFYGKLEDAARLFG